MKEINNFRREYHWLSNFYPVDITYKNIIYPSVEHAFVSAKNEAPEWKTYCSNRRNAPGEVKVMGRSIKLISNWNIIKIDVMRECLRCKFSQEPFKTKLLETENADIVEGNDWGDTYWGFDTRKQQGKNYLGRLIMEIREELKN